MRTNILLVSFCVTGLLSQSALSAIIPKLFNTGVDASGVALPAATKDEHYRLMESADPDFAGPDTFTLAPGFPVPPWIAETDQSRWIAPRAEQGTGNAEGDFTFETTFDLTGFDPSTATITGRWSVDNTGKDIVLNGQSLGIGNAAGFGGWTAFTIGSGFVSGVNTLQFIINNAAPTPNPIGVRVEMTGRATGASEAPSIITQPASQSVVVGDLVTLSLEPAGTAPLSYQWQFNGTPIPGATEASYTIAKAATNQSGNYSLIVTNAFGRVVSSNSTLTVLVPYPGVYNTGVSDSREPLADLAEDLHYKLVLNANDPASTTTFVEDSTVFPIVDGPWLPNSAKSKWIGPLPETSGAAAGNYTYLLVLDLTGYDPASAFLAGSWATDDGGTLFLNGADTGFASAGFTSFSTFNLTNGFVSGTNHLEFRLSNGAAGYTGLRVENLRGTAQAKAGGQSAPVVVTQPKPATKVMTDSVTFTAVADASPAPSFQWLKNGTAIAGATNSSLNFPFILPENAGTYSVRVSNSLGSTNSLDAQLNVIQPELGVYPTGVDSSTNALPGGATDPHYVLLASPDPAYPGPVAYVPASAPIPPWVENLAASAWIGGRADATEALPGTYQYRLIFNIATQDVATAAITASIATDDGNGGLLLNGNHVDLGATAFTSYADLNIPAGSPFVGGLNTLDFFVSNGGAAANPTGLRVDNIVISGVTVVDAPRPRLGITRTGANLTVTWNADGTLQSADKVEGPYTEVTGATGRSYAVPAASTGNKFYRVFRP